MIMTKATIGKVPLDDFVSVVAGVYKKQDIKRTIWDVWLHATHHAAAIGEEVRKYKPGQKLLEEIADFSMWLLTFVSKIHQPTGSIGAGRSIEESTVFSNMYFSEIIWNKYPGVCPICFRRYIEAGRKPSRLAFCSPCSCLLHEVESRSQDQKMLHTTKLREFAESKVSNKPGSVDKWQEMFGEIFEANLRHLRLEDIAFHLLEEVGEVSDAMARMYTYTAEDFKHGEPQWRQKWLEEEVADVASWLFTLVNALDIMPEIAKAFQQFLYKDTALPDTRITLSRIIWNRYGSDDIKSLYCPHDCKKPVCDCPILLVIDEESLKKFKGLLNS